MALVPTTPRMLPPLDGEETEAQRAVGRVGGQLSELPSSHITPGHLAGVTGRQVQGTLGWLRNPPMG